MCVKVKIQVLGDFVDIKKVVKPESGDTKQNSTSADNVTVKTKNKYRGRYFRRSKPLKTDEVKSNEETMPLENNENIPPQRPRKKNRNFHVDFSLHVSNIEKKY
ncbi:hypothetical protein NQ314_018624 [Rhamnusium bicolor]|uniref:Uncharacterized protein n=1 Tax=Rhamnusium bicolor TaxID=1586634 RepID=A0AAV8WSN6_9CUCU|nr:hypothetical protein NQ314_018624 [Rhamnusium bicolor]